MPEETSPSHFHKDRLQNNQELGKITPELVRNITDRVYAMLVADLKIERERQSQWAERASYRKGRP